MRAADATPLSRLSLRLRATAESDQSLRAGLREWLEEVGGSEGDIFDFQSACCEALTALIGVRSRPVTLIVEIDAWIDGRTANVSIRDYGLCREPDGLEAESAGLLLTRALMDAVEVHPHPDGNTILLSRTAAQTSRGEYALHRFADASGAGRSGS
jgi:anti-sigma regulatory factor (Ser/Thr protein kinase)